MLLRPNRAQGGLDEAPERPSWPPLHVTRGWHSQGPPCLPETTPSSLIHWNIGPRPQVAMSGPDNSPLTKGTDNSKCKPFSRILSFNHLGGSWSQLTDEETEAQTPTGPGLRVLPRVTQRKEAEGGLHQPWCSGPVGRRYSGAGRVAAPKKPLLREDVLVVVFHERGFVFLGVILARREGLQEKVRDAS